MGIRGCPIILVHGWKSHPGIWKRFIPLLTDASLPVWSFGYDKLNGASLADLAAALQQFIVEKQVETGYEGAIDIVGHCMGTCVSRYMLEVLDRETRSLEVRQLIGLGPPNNGSSIAELFCDPIHGPGKIRLLQQTGTLDARNAAPERVMDSNELERERGITILAKNTAVHYGDILINIVDTPGHADFGGEVERVLSVVDSVLLLVDAVDGPMPQTRFVTRKAFEAGLNPIVVVNKVDRPGARPHWVVDQVFDLFDRLGATEQQLDFPVIYASELNGVAGHEPDALAADMAPLLDLNIERVPPPPADPDGPFHMQICALDYSNYVGVIGIGRIRPGTVARRPWRVDQSRFEVHARGEAGAAASLWQ